jgi:putative phosphoserine phosphatase/1-acylglycerol-3-phosphate O-acyltransferase
VTVVVKREFLFVPFMGLAMFAFNFVMIDRKDRERAKRSMQGAAERINKRAASVIIAPEGTRSSTGELGPFKMGAFHLALATKAPIVPIVLRGCSKLQPLGRWIPARGVVTVDILPEIATDDWDEEGLKARRDELREVYVDALKGRPGESDQRAG